MLQSAQQLRQLVFPAWETCTQNARTVSSELIMYVYSPEILLQCMVAVIMLYNIFHPTPGFVESIIIIAVQTQLRLSSV